MTENVTTNPTTPISNATNPSPYTPLSREELAAFMMYNESQMKEISSHMSELISAQSSISADHTKTSQEQLNLIAQQMNLTKSFMTVTTEQQRAFCDATIKVINRQAATMDKILTALLEFIPNKIHDATIVSNPINVSSSATTPQEVQTSLHDFDNIDDPDVWKSKVLNFICNYCKSHGYNEKFVMNSVYEEIENENHIRLIKNTSKIQYISQNHELRLLFPKCFDNALNRNKFHTSNAINNMRSTPAVIRRALDPLVFEGCNISGILMSIYHEMDKYLKPRSLNCIKKEFIKETGYKYVHMSYIISQDPELMELFEKVVKSRL